METGNKIPRGNARRPTRKPRMGCACRGVLSGLLIGSTVCLLSGFVLVLTGKAAWGPTPHNLEEWRRRPAELVAEWTASVIAMSGRSEEGQPAFEMVPTITRAASATAFLPLPSDTLVPTYTPSSTVTRTASVTLTETATASPTASPSETTTPSPSPTYTPSWMLTASRSPTRTRTPTRSPSRTPTVAPALPTWTASATSEGWPETATAIGPATATLPPPSSTPQADCAATGNASFESSLLALVNAERESRGLRAYRLQPQLQAAARSHSRDMACNGFVSHTGSDGSSVRDRVEREGYDWSWIGENIFATGDTSTSAPQRAFDWWMNSAPHQANLLSPNYTEIGLGYHYLAGSGYGGSFTAVFARP